MRKLFRTLTVLLALILLTLAGTVCPISANVSSAAESPPDAAQQSGAIGVDALMDGRREYDGRLTTVTGLLRAIKERHSKQGKSYDLLLLCEKRCVRLVVFGHTDAAKGQRLMASGVYNMKKNVGSHTFINQITIDSPSAIKQL